VIEIRSLKCLPGCIQTGRWHTLEIINTVQEITRKRMRRKEYVHGVDEERWLKGERQEG
jgi:hypothetical protein